MGCNTLRLYLSLYRAGLRADFRLQDSYLVGLNSRIRNPFPESPMLIDVCFRKPSELFLIFQHIDNAIVVGFVLQINRFLNNEASLSQANGHWRRHRFPEAASLQTFQSFECTIEGSLGRSFCAEKSV